MADKPRPLRNLNQPQAGNQEEPPVNRRPKTGILGGWNPPPIASVEDLGLTKLRLADLVLKLLHFRGDLIGHDVADELHLPFTGVTDQILEFLKREKLIEIKGSVGFGESSYRYEITSEGVQRALDALERSQYVGPAPVPLGTYIEAMEIQKRPNRSVTEADMLRVMQNLIVNKDMLDKLGPAANSGTSIFLYGPPGNGKTTMAEAIGRVILGADMWIPYSIDVDGEIIQVFDFVNHELSEDQSKVRYGTGEVADPRWVRIKRPIIVVGGELTLESLDLVYNQVSKYYEAPYQVKANGGMFLIDDFGRQQVSPHALLNRWIVPLEK